MLPVKIVYHFKIIFVLPSLAWICIPYSKILSFLLQERSWIYQQAGDTDAVQATVWGLRSLVLRGMKNNMSFPNLGRSIFFFWPLLFLVVPFTALRSVSCLWVRLLQECLGTFENKLMIWPWNRCKKDLTPHWYKEKICGEECCAYSHCLLQPRKVIWTALLFTLFPLNIQLWKRRKKSTVYWWPVWNTNSVLNFLQAVLIWSICLSDGWCYAAWSTSKGSSLLAGKLSSWGSK